MLRQLKRETSGLFAPLTSNPRRRASQRRGDAETYPPCNHSVVPSEDRSPNDPCCLFLVRGEQACVAGGKGSISFCEFWVPRQLAGRESLRVEIRYARWWFRKHAAVTAVERRRHRCFSGRRSVEREGAKPRDTSNGYHTGFGNASWGIQVRKDKMGAF